MIRHVRGMQPTDLEAVYAIERVAHRAPWSRDILSDCMLVGYDCRILESMENNAPTLIAYIISRYQDPMTCHVLNICVAPLFQGHGHGAFLLEHVMHAPQQSTTNAFVLEVRPSNLVALQLYQKLGFQQVAVKRGYYREDPILEDAIVLRREFSSGSNSA